MKWTTADHPRAYWIRDVTYRCGACASEFHEPEPSGDTLVKFYEIGGSERRWLPTYTKGGFLDLFSTLVPGASDTTPMTMQLSAEFDKRLRPLIEPSSSGRSFSFLGKTLCRKCGSSALKAIEERDGLTPPLVWLSYASPPSQNGKRTDEEP